MQKYKEIIMYLALIILLAVFLFQQIKPRFNNFMRLFGELKSQKTIAESLNSQLSIAKAKVERKQKMRLIGDVTKKIYEPTGTVADTETSFSVLFDDIIEIARKNGIKTHSIEYIYNPQNDVFVKGDSSKFLACQLNMKIVTDYTDFEKFLQDLYKYNYLVNVNEVEVYPYEKNKRILLMNVSLTLYATRSSNIPDESNAPVPIQEKSPQQPSEPLPDQPPQPDMKP